MDDPWKQQLLALGGFIRAQRELARLSLRDLADLAHVSNPYLSQLERGMHEPSIRVLKSIAAALGVPPETLLTEVGLLDEDTVAAADAEPSPSTEAAIQADTRLTKAQKSALIAVYRGFLEES